MLTTGDLARSGTAYVLSDRLLERQRPPARSGSPRVSQRWRGDWEVVVVTATGRSAADRAALRTALVDHRLGELREGVWMRPDNLTPWPDDEVDERLVYAHPSTTPGRWPSSCSRLAWMGRQRAAQILNAVAEREPGRPVRRLRRRRPPPADRPRRCPPSCCPTDWPAAEIRAAYDESLSWMASLL